MNEMEEKGDGITFAIQISIRTLLFHRWFSILFEKKARNHSQIIKLYHYLILKFIEYRLKRTYIYRESQYIHRLNHKKIQIYPSKTT